MLMLRYSPIAFKLIFDESKIPEGSMRPMRDTGNRPALCLRIKTKEKNDEHPKRLNNANLKPGQAVHCRVAPGVWR